MEKISFKRAFRAAIRKYLNTTFPREASRAKVEIEKLINATTEPNARETIDSVLAEFGMLTGWLENHFTPGSLFTDRGWVFGWYHPEQLQARRLPVKLSATYFKGTFRKIEVTENRDGFRVAEPLPFVDGFPVEIPAEKTHLLARYGWAAAVPLQWHRESDGLLVDRTILSCGFAIAWKWWPAATNYYAKYPPSPLLEDCRIETGSDLYLRARDSWLA
ncbi:hypothetical protein QUA42_27020 [Microcoleus sp. Pol11C2]|uniref:hypothetical protein n=1 Tax=Microcoleus sp. Pol11C2 TaxID=3055389 RepID=UPI002FD5C677